MIELQDVVIRRGRKTLLGSLSLTVQSNEFIGVIGPNGAGKTTLLNTVLGLEPITSGTIRMRGETFRTPGRGYAAVAKRAWGVLFQNHHFYPDVPFTAEDVVAFGQSHRRSGQGDAVAAALDMLGLASMRKRLYRDLSGGEKQKVQLARLLAQAADGWLLDEPTSGLDLDWQERLIRTVETVYHETRKTVIMVTHDVDHLPACCSRVVMLQHGNIMAQGAPEEVCRPDMFSTLYGCDMDVVRRNGRFHAFSLGPGAGA